MALGNMKSYNGLLLFQEKEYMCIGILYPTDKLCYEKTQLGILAPKQMSFPKTARPFE
jgi:hypothetical protein